MACGLALRRTQPPWATPAPGAPPTRVARKDAGRRLARTQPLDDILDAGKAQLRLAVEQGSVCRAVVICRGRRRRRAAACRRRAAACRRRAAAAANPAAVRQQLCEARMKLSLWLLKRRRGDGGALCLVDQRVKPRVGKPRRVQPQRHLQVLRDVGERLSHGCVLDGADGAGSGGKGSRR